MPISWAGRVLATCCLGCRPGRRVRLLLSLGFALGLPPATPAAALATQTATFTGSVSPSTAWRANAITVSTTGTISATLDWDDATANLGLFLIDPSGAQVAKVTTSGVKPKTLSFAATQTGTWKVAVKAITGAANFTLTATFPGSASGGSGLVSFDGSYGFSGPAGLYAYGMDYDASDDTILVGDYWNYRVWRYTTGGTLIGLVSTHAAGGNAGGITAPYDVEADTAAADADPQGQAPLWVADQGSSRVVEFSHGGQWLQTIGKTNAGQATGTSPAYPGHAYAQGCGGGQMQIPTHILVDEVRTTHYLYVSDPRCHAVYIFDHDGGFHGSLDWTGSGIGTPIPRGIAEDASGYVYVVEFNSRRIVVFDPAGQYVGESAPQNDLNDPRGLDIDQSRHFIYTVGAYWNRVYQFSFDPTSHAVAFVNEWRNIDGSNYAPSHAGTQPFDSIRFPAVDSAGNVYVGETWGCDAFCTGTPYGYGVEKFTPRATAGTSCDPTTANTAETTCAGAVPDTWATPPQPPPRGGFNQQNGIAIDPADQSLFVVDTFEQRVQRLDTMGTCAPGNCPAWELEWGSRAPASPTSDGFGYPRALAFGDDGRVWVGDNNNDVMAFQPDGTFVHRFGSTGKAAGQFSGGVQGIDVQGGHVYATDVAGCRLQVFDEAKLLTATSIATAPTGTLLADMGSCGRSTGQMTAPRGLAVSGSTVYVAETGSNRITRWTVDYATGTGTATVITPSCGGKGLAQPWGITWDPSHTWLYIGDVANKRIVRMSPDGATCQVVVSQADLPAPYQFLGGNFVAFGADPSPGVERMYVSDNSRHVYAFDVTG